MTYRFVLLVGTLLPALTSAVSPCSAQDSQRAGGRSAPSRLAIGFGVDTMRAPAREIFQLWRTYLASRPESLRSSPHWSQVEQAKYPDFDILRGFVYQGFPNFTVVHLAPSAGEKDVYEVRTLVSRVDRESNDVQPLALFRVYAVREEGRWVLANALARQTRDWRREAIGHVTFFSPPAYRFDQMRARRTAEFVDSLAIAFSLTPPVIEYFVSVSLSETFRAMGLDYFPLGPDTAGGRAQPTNKLVFVGGSTAAEGNHHELAHIVLAPLTTTRTHRLIGEGLATWVGGSAGLEYRALLPGLRQWLQQHPTATLRSILVDPPMREGTLDVGYNTLAVVCELVFEHGGVAAIRALSIAGPTADDVLLTVSRLLGRSGAELDTFWRRRILDHDSRE